ncbi:hypothetical protein SAMN04488103_103169 [Gemmobacter aquatilis]|uniref:Uncharacterized protein n=1 Tax=Gemmobacter aquatilis TaxID=933059 RepID=A0A1H8DYT7_9RHOB|nr:hypothetical protein [Gemmobacter aquatilis]SEN12373.1 hypothetical protein SAMN04488103_103169 [Gemmobacter aquatilis]
MAGQDLSEFYARLARIEDARAKGHGFEADGTLGRSYYTKPSRKRSRLIGPLLVILACGTGLKASMYYQIGSASYLDRVERMRESEGFARLGGFLMQADPVTVQTSALIDRLLH